MPFDGCARADQLAAQNDATVVCEPLTGEPPGYKVEATTNKTVGDSIVPGTDDKRSKQQATAVIESACEFELPAADAEADVLPKLTCDDGDWTLDPKNLEDLPGPEDLFDVHLAD